MSKIKNVFVIVSNPQILCRYYKFWKKWKIRFHQGFRIDEYKNDWWFTQTKAQTLHMWADESWKLKKVKIIWRELQQGVEEVVDFLFSLANCQHWWYVTRKKRVAVSQKYVTLPPKFSFVPLGLNAAAAASSSVSWNCLCAVFACWSRSFAPFQVLRLTCVQFDSFSSTKWLYIVPVLENYANTIR